MSSAIGVASALLFIALLLSLAAAESKWEEILKTPWEELEKRTRTAPRFMTQQFHDRPLPVEQIPQFPHQADKMCNCKLHGGDWSKPYYLNTGAVVYQGTTHLAFLRHILVKGAKMTYKDGNTVDCSSVAEINEIIVCKSNHNMTTLSSCFLVDQSEGYEERHPRNPFDVWGNNDPRLFVARDALFLQAGCRPSWNTHWMGELPCIMRLMGEGGDWGRQWPLRQAVMMAEKRPDPGWEKNWVHFRDPKSGDMLWSRTLLPHAVMTLTPNGTLQQMHHTSNPEVFAHLRHVCGKGPRGNTPAVYLPARLSGADRDYFLGTLHWSPVQSPQFVTDPEYECGSYINYWYLMEATAPFNIAEVSMSPIPLMAKSTPFLDMPVAGNNDVGLGMGFISFPTGLILQPSGQVVLTYGSGDIYARVFVTHIREVMATFASGALRRRQTVLQKLQK